MSAALGRSHDPSQTGAEPRARAGAPARLLPDAVGQPTSLREHEARYGQLPHFTSAKERALLLDAIEASGLRGRGGAGFPTATKLRAVARGVRPIVVANGTEGEPASAKDKALMWANPHLVLDGALAAAEGVGAGEIILAVSNAQPRIHGRLGIALEERRQAGTTQSVRLVAVPERFVAGEESALVHFLNGGPPLPTLVPPRPFERGVRGAPTLVQNVETLANIGLIARNGPEWFRRWGTPEEPGTVLVSVLGAVGRPGVLELPLGLELSELFRLAGGFSAAPRAILVGGYFGTWIDAASLAGLTLSGGSLASVGASLGARSFAVLPEGLCGIEQSARVARYLSDQSAGQCGPCLFGLRALAAVLEAMTAGAADARAQRTRLPRLSAQIARRGACAHPDGALSFVESATRVFAAEIEDHLQGRCNRSHGRAFLPTPGGAPTR
jgi:NADH:ubiquinone oxidoreductase subunit F (NADH-binding)